MKLFFSVDLISKYILYFLLIFYVFFYCLGAKLSSITALHIYNMTADNFNFGKLSPQLSHLISFSITNSYINRLLGRLEHTHQITCLNLSNNAFGTEWQDPLALENLKYLAMLDFSNVNISRLPVIKIQVPIFWLDVSSIETLKSNKINFYNTFF